MRYLVTVIAVLALASPAMSECGTPSNSVEARYDSISDLPAEKANIVDLDCSTFSWKFEFDRTDKTDGSLTIHAIIDNTDVNKSYLSSLFDPEEHHIDGPKTGSIDAGETDNRLRITRTPVDMTSGWFENMKLSVSKYQE